MMTAIILLKTERTKINDVAEAIAGIKGISEVYSVSGNFDLVAIARVSDNEALADLVTTRLVEIDHIIETETMMALRVFSKHDLDAMFSIGF